LTDPSCFAYHDQSEPHDHHYDDYDHDARERDRGRASAQCGLIHTTFPLQKPAPIPVRVFCFGSFINTPFRDGLARLNLQSTP
jgi:hypothetical protein